MANLRYIPYVVQVVPYKDKTIVVYFDDGAVRLYDVKPLLRVGTVFEPMLDDSFFRERLTILNQTVAWDIDGDRNVETCVDLDPIMIYRDGTKISDLPTD